jgi:hypothetical protein
LDFINPSFVNQVQTREFKYGLQVLKLSVAEICFPKVYLIESEKKLLPGGVYDPAMGTTDPQKGWGTFSQKPGRKQQDAVAGPSASDTYFSRLSGVHSNRK